MKKILSISFCMFLVYATCAQTNLVNSFDAFKSQKLYKLDFMGLTNDVSIDYSKSNQPNSSNTIDFRCFKPTNPGNEVSCNGLLIDATTAFESDVNFRYETENGVDVSYLQNANNKVCMVYKNNIVFASLPTAKLNQNNEIIAFKDNLMPPVIITTIAPTGDVKTAAKNMLPELKPILEAIAKKVYPLAIKARADLFAAGEKKYSNGINKKINEATNNAIAKWGFQNNALATEAKKQVTDAAQSEQNFIDRFNNNIENNIYGDFRTIITEFYDEDETYEFVRIKRWKSDRGAFADTYTTEVVTTAKPIITKVYVDDDASKQCIGLQIKEEGSANDITGGTIVKSLKKKTNFILHDDDENENPKGGHFMIAFFYKNCIYIRFKDGYDDVKEMTQAYSWYIIKPKKMAKLPYNISMFDLNGILSDYGKRDQQLNK